MAFDQRPAQATKRIMTVPSAPTKPSSTPAKFDKADEVKAIQRGGLKWTFLIASVIGGILTTAAFYGLIPGLQAIPVPAFK